MNKSEIDEQNKKEYENIYQNCLHFISKRLIILKMMDVYMEDSQIISGFIRIFRKIVQMLTTENISMTDKSKDPRVFVREFRVYKIHLNSRNCLFLRMKDCLYFQSVQCLIDTTITLKFTIIL
jgi:hypothetical protein